MLLHFCFTAAADTQQRGAGEPAVPVARFVTLGTGGGPVIRGRAQSANAVLVGGDVYLFDLGAGATRQLQAADLSLSAIRAVFISHHHVDHNADLAPFLLTRWVLQQPTRTPVWGPAGTRHMVEAVLDAYAIVELAPVALGGPEPPKLSETAVGYDVPPSETAPIKIYEDENVRVTALLNAHYHFPPDTPEALHSRSYSYSIEVNGRKIVYTGDTGVSRPLASFAQGADLLVAEVMDYDRVAASITRLGFSTEAEAALLAHLRASHLSAEEVGQLAAEAGVKKVVLTHLVPGLDTEADTSHYSEGVRLHFSGPVSVAQDLQVFAISADTESTANDPLSD
jgi:ribonuclease BN (tRNA processing enzyme)